ncbi:MAG: glycerol-3-phosphate acyltransferase, partial [Acetobacteraceae bacterium]|nr:glycerol-3-phosphate acyltransferase [Acetobacteraceae bacterium]
GSGNIGATNVLRTGRGGLALATLLLDGGKGAIAVLLAVWTLGPLGIAVGGIFAVLGHLFPLWLGFRGGKGVATAFGALIMAAPAVGLIAGAVWIAVAFLSKFSSAGSLCAFAAAPLIAAVAVPTPSMLTLTASLTVLVWVRHEANIRRLLAGTEPRIGQRH